RTANAPSRKPRIVGWEATLHGIHDCCVMGVAKSYVCTPNSTQVPGAPEIHLVHGRTGENAATAGEPMKISGREGALAKAIGEIGTGVGPNPGRLGADGYAECRKVCSSIEL